MRSRYFAFLFLATVITASASATASNNQAKPNYFPLSEGATWHYKMEAPGAAVETIVVQAGKGETIGAGVAYRLEQTARKGQKPITETIRSDDTGVYRIRVEDKEINKPICLLKYPVKAGEKWQDDVEIAGLKMTVEVEVGKEEEVQVPAGKYKTVSVQVKSSLGGVDISSTYWFSDGVGIVKQSAEIGGQKYVQELEKHDKGK